MNETTMGDVVYWIGKQIRHYDKLKEKKRVIYITSECLERLNQIYMANSITELTDKKTILGLEIIEITPDMKFAWKEMEDIRKSEIKITSTLTIHYMKYREPRLKRW